MKIEFLLFSIAVSLLSSCATRPLASRDDYVEARLELAAGRPAGARQVFTTNEDGGFLTTAEKTWIDLLHAPPRLENILRTSGDIEKRKTVYVSQELFYKETEEGYYPAEHEVIYFHLLAALSFAKAAKPAEARVEVAKAAHYLEKHFAYERGSFDDPYLRLLLASLWTYLGEWEHARVDFRVIRQLSPSAKWAGELAEMERPPAAMNVVFAGVGPAIGWDAIKGLGDLGPNRLRFEASYRKPEVKILGKGKPVVLNDRFETLRWYERHRDRNDELRDAINKSKYMVEATGSGGAAALKLGLHKAAAVSLTTLGIAAGVGIAGLGLYAASKTGSGDMTMAALGLGAATAGYVAYSANQEEEAANAKAIGTLNEEMDLSRRYRYLRFIPDALYFSYSKTASDFEAENAAGKITPFLALKSKYKSTVNYFFFPTDGALAPERTWIDRENKNLWAHDGRTGNYIEAGRACAQLAHSTGDAWRLPRWNELFAAIQNGLNENSTDGNSRLFTRPNPLLWLERGPLDQFECKSARVNKKALELETKCESEAIALCVLPGGAEAHR